MKRYSKQGLWSLFLISAFPQHIWTLILALRDFSWVSERTNSWDAVGVISYGLLFALIESIVVFVIALLLGFLISKKWAEDRRNTLLGMLVFVTSLWAMFNYYYFLSEKSLIPYSTLVFLSGLKHPLRFLYVFSLVIVVITVTLPSYFILHSEKFLQAIKGFFERLSLLSTFYLFFDFIGLIIVIIRNI